MQRGDDEPIRLVDYDSRWPSLFESERELLARVLAPWLAGPIEHIGSTAVPGLRAKPVIDIMVAVENLEISRSAIPPLEKIEYCHAPYAAEVEHWFCKPRPSFRTHHLHLVPFGSRRWVDSVAFRDRLRSDPEVAREYLVLKQRLAEVHPLNRDAYTDGKGPFIGRILEEFASKRSAT